MAILAFTSITRFRGITHDNQSHAESFVPAKRLTTEFEREILNARIFFIYYVTIQKPGSLEAGWKRYHQAEDRLNSIAKLVDDRDELREMRVPVSNLQADLKSYGVALASTLQMVQGGETKGPHFDAQVKEWAARGAVMVGAAGEVQTLCLHLSEANTLTILTSLRDGVFCVGATFLLSLCVCLLLTSILVRRLRSEADEVEGSGISGTGLPSEVGA